MSKSKSVDVPTDPVCSSTKQGIPPWRLFHGVKASMEGKICCGCLPEEIARDPSPKNCQAYMTSARVQFTRREDGDGKFSVMLCVGDELAVVLEPGDFVDAFLAVVPRWFWTKKDAR